MPFAVVVADDVREFLCAFDEKSKRVCKKNLAKLSQPYPGGGSGDKERLMVDGEEVYHLHIGRTFTAFYIIDERARIVRILELLPIKEAHKKYGF